MTRIRSRPKRKRQGPLSILIVARWPVGGIRTFLRYVYMNFSPHKYKLTLVAPDLPEARMLLDDLKEFNPSARLIDPRPSSYDFFKEVSKLICKSDFDLIHSQGHTAAVASAIPALITSTPHIFTSHDMFNIKQFIGNEGKIKKFFISAALLFPDIIHLVSNDAYHNLSQNLFLVRKIKSKCRIIPHGIDTKQFLESNRLNLREIYCLPKNSYLIGFMGRFMSPKGFRYLVAAMKKVLNEYAGDKLPIVLCFGEGGFIREEKENIRNEGLEKYFFFYPFRQNIASVLKGLDIVVMPSTWEACGLLAMETLVSGVPLISSDCVGLREVTRDTPTITFRSKDSNALSKLLIKEIKDSSKYVFSKYSLIADKKFNSKNQSESIEKLILTLTNFQTRRHPHPNLVNKARPTKKLKNKTA